MREVLHGQPGALDLEELRSVRGAHPISIADGAFAELVAQLARGSISLTAWQVVVARLDALLDLDWPVAPGGRERAAISGMLEEGSVDLESTKSHSRIAWTFLRNLRHAADLASGVIGGPDGRRYQIAAAGTRAQHALAQAATGWLGFIERMATIIQNIPQVTAEDVRSMVAAQLAVDMSPSALARLDLPLRVIAGRAYEAGRGRTPYKGSQQDAIDLDLLFAVGMPAIICTADRALLDLVQKSGSADRQRVVPPSGLLDWLRGLPLPP